jgi:hypothetical protein
MKRTTLISLSIAAAAFFGACSQQNTPQVTVRNLEAQFDEAKMLVTASDVEHEAQPAAAEEPQLPQGHPDISEMMKQYQAQQPQVAEEEPSPEQAQQMQQQLPPGHPDISEMMKQRQPQQNKAQPAQDAAQLPPGHPPLPQDGSAPAVPAQQAHIEHSEKPAMFGTLTIQATQGTPSAPAIGAAAVAIELYHNGKLMSKLDAKLDASGKAVVEDLPLTVAFQPAVKLTYGGIEYQAVGHLMDSNHPKQSLQVLVYEGAEDAPAWNIRMQHVMLQPTADGMQVMEMLAIENPTDRSWIGKADVSGARRTFELVLPTGAQHVQFLEGFDECCTKVENGVVINPKPVVPGTTQYQFAYYLPITNGKAELTLAAAAPVKHLMVFVPEDGSSVVAQGLEDMGSSDMKNGKTRFFKAGNVEAGQQVALAISGIKPVAVAATATAVGSAKAAQVLAIGGGLLIFVVGGFFLFIRAPKAAKAA